jgi:hypothetical protein
MYWLGHYNMTHIIRYEDLIHHKQEALTDLAKFILETQDIKDTNMEQLILTMSKTDVYKPRQGKVGANLQYFTP